MSEAPAQQAKKRNKRKKKKVAAAKSGQTGSPSCGDDSMPKQSSDQAEGVVTTTKCQRCKRPFRQFVKSGAATSDSVQQPWKLCPHCLLTSEEERVSLTERESQNTAEKDLSSYGCNCAACIAKRESAVPAEVEKEAQITQMYWMEIRHIVRCIYRENTTLENQSTRSSIGSDKMRMIVKRLCSRDPHQFFQRLETLAREYLLEVKVRLLEQLSCGFNSPQLAIEFIEMLLEEYSSLASSLPPLLYLLEPLEETEYVKSVGVTVELMNKNIFRELIFAESFMSSNLPLIIAQLRLASLASDPYHRNTADALSQRYVALDREMEEICCVWRSAKEHLNHTHQHHESRRQCEIRADGKEFVKMKNESLSVTGKAKHADSAPSAHHHHHHQQHQEHQEQENEVSDNSTQLNEWSRLLFKCIRPIGEPEFKQSGGIATHTITLRLDMTELDLCRAQPTCCRGDLKKYQRLGLTVEEVVEVSMKLNCLRSLGLHLKIEDLFDEQGFSLSQVNRALSRLRQQQNSGVGAVDDVFFIESDDGEESEEEEKKTELTSQEKEEMQRAKERILRRQELGNPQSRLTDFLQGMTMKIRFMKKITGSNDTSFLPSNGGQLLFSSCDQVQMKLTQLELSSARLTSTGHSCVGSDLGLSDEPSPSPPPPRLSSGSWNRDDHVFMHTDSHKEFMDLLLERRSQLEADVVKKASEEMAATDPTKVTGSRSNEAGKKSDTTPLSNGVKGHEGVMGFTPVYQPNSTQPCQCSACVGAIAASITKENSRPLNPTDPSSGNLTIQSSLDLVLSRPQRTKKPPSPPASKEMIWQKWLATSGNSQIQSHAHSDHTHLHYHHHHHHHGDGVDVDSGYGDSLKSSCSMACDCHDHSHDNHNGCSLPTYCTSVANGGSSSPSTTGAGGGGGGEGSRRYCPCCYCELFGNNGPTPAPTSHNFTKQRDKMRHKLEEKKKREREINRHYHVQHNSSETDCRPLDELLAFIEGEEDNEVGGVTVTMATNTSRPGKKKKKTKKQPSLPATEEEPNDHQHASDVREGVVESRGGASRSHTHQVTEKVKGQLNKPHPLSSSTSAVNNVPATTAADVSVDEFSDDYDDELEAFKKICFAAPAVNRKRIAVALDMNDLMSKMK